MFGFPKSSHTTLGGVGKRLAKTQKGSGKAVGRDRCRQLFDSGGGYKQVERRVGVLKGKGKWQTRERKRNGEKGKKKRATAKRNEMFGGKKEVLVGETQNNLDMKDLNTTKTMETNIVGVKKKNGPTPVPLWNGDFIYRKKRSIKKVLPQVFKKPVGGWEGTGRGSRPRKKTEEMKENHHQNKKIQQRSAKGEHKNDEGFKKRGPNPMEGWEKEHTAIGEQVPTKRTEIKL